MPQTFNVGARSLFVTAIAWMTMVLGVGMVAGLGSGLLAPWPWAASTVAALSLAAVIAAAGLLMRLDWARRVFIALLVLVIAAHLPGLWLQYQVVQHLVGDGLRGAGPVSPAVEHLFSLVVMASLGMAAALTSAACALLAWAVRRLMSPSIRQEFA